MSQLIFPWELGVGNLIQAVPALRAIRSAFPSITVLTKPQPGEWWVEATRFLLHDVVEFTSVEFTADAGTLQLNEQNILTTFWQSAQLHQFACMRDIPWFHNDNRAHMPEWRYFADAATAFGFPVMAHHFRPYLARQNRPCGLLFANTGKTDTYLCKRYPGATKLVAELQELCWFLVAVGDPIHIAFTPRHNCSNKSFADSLAAIHTYCGFAITNDCLWGHAAASLLAIPTVVIYGPTRGSKNRPWGAYVTEATGEECPTHPCEYSSAYTQCTNRKCFPPYTTVLTALSFVRDMWARGGCTK